MLLFSTSTNVPPPVTRNKTGIKAIIDRAIVARQKVTLEEAVAILRANWG